MWAQAPGIQCSQLADVAPLGAGLEKLQALTFQFLRFGRCSALAEKLGGLQQLQFLKLDLSDSFIWDVAALGAGLEKLQALTSLNLNFAQCKQLADVAPLGAGLEKLQALTSLKLHFSYCRQLADELQRSFDNKESFLAAVVPAKSHSGCCSVA